MKHHGTLLLMALLLALPAIGLRADQTDPRLDGLFATLQDTASEGVAAATTAEIWSIWLETDDADVAASLAGGMAAMRRGELDKAEEAFDAAVNAAPDFAEAWNKRATVRYLRGDLGGSIADVRATLALEPRHFGALSGLGMIYERLDEPDLALESLKAALDVNPHLEATRARVRLLEQAVGGAPI